MPDSETKILRDELARTIAELGRKDRTIADKDRTIAGKDLTIVGLIEQLAEVTAEKTMLTAENQQLKQHIKYYENPHTPSRRTRFRPGRKRLLLQRHQATYRHLQRQSRAAGPDTREYHSAHIKKKNGP